MGRGALGVAQRPIPLHLGSAESGVDRRCEIAKTAMRSHRVVIVLPGCQYFACTGKRREQRLVEAFVAQPAVEALDERILLRFPGCHSMPCCCDQRSIVMQVSSVPLSETIIAGQPRRVITASSSRATRRPGNDVSATSARHSRVKSSTIARMRNRRPSANASDRKSRLQRWFGPFGSEPVSLRPACDPIAGAPGAVLHGRVIGASYGS